MASPVFLLAMLAAGVTAGVVWRGRAAVASPSSPPPTPPTTPPTSSTSSTPEAPPASTPTASSPPATSSTPRAPSAGRWTPYTFTRATSGRHARINLNDPMIQRWQPLIYGAAVVWGPRMHADISQLMQFAIAWMGAESGGNECAVGNKYTTVPPGGAPREIGLWQIYNPDDFTQLGLDPLELVAYCVRTPTGVKNPQKLTRPMTDAESAKHVSVGLQLIGMKRAYAQKYLGHSGVQWPSHSIDTWRMTKAVHALPVLVNTAIAQVTKKLGRPPISWAEYRSTYETINPRAKYDPRKDDKGSGINPKTGKPFYGEEQDGYYRALENAEWTGSQVSPLANA